MVGRRFKLERGYSFYILHQDKHWFTNRVYPNISKVQAVMLGIMKSGNISACPIMAIGQDVAYKYQKVWS